MKTTRHWGWILLGLILRGAVLQSGSYGQTPSASWLPYFLAGDGVLPTYGASVAVDSKGGIHAAYAIYTGTDQEKKPAVYAYCPGDPGDPGNWTFTRVGEAVQDVRLALDPAGRPRLMLFGPKADPDTDLRMQYQYAECNGGCTGAVNWTLTTVATPIEAIGTREDNNNRYFAVGAQGQAAFVYTDTSNNNHPGTFYVSCPGGCAAVENWTETTLTTRDVVDKPSLVFTEDGRPRLACGMHHEGQLYLGYAECNGDPTDPRQWSSILLLPIHGSAFYSLQVTPTGEPRLAFSSGAYAAAPFTDHQLYYLWCKDGCTADAGNWGFNNVGLYLTSGNVDLALDRTQARPRMSYLTAEGLGFAWCDQNAESDSADWQYRVMESNAALAEQFEVLPIHLCTVSAWINGQRSCLALDAAGNPFISYDAQHIWNGVYVDKPWESCGFKDVTVTRFASFATHPTSRLSIRRVTGQLELTFASGTLEFADGPSGPWTPLDGVSSPFRVNPDKAKAFYRVRQP